MPVSSIAQIIFRIFALNWFLTGLIQGGTFLYLSGNGRFYWMSFLPGFIYFLAGIVLWLVSPGLSRVLAKGNDGTVSLAGVTERTLFATAFLSLGLYFALKSFAGAVSWIHFFAMNRSPDYGFVRNESPSYYDLSENILTMVAGIALILTAKIWAAKLSPPEDAKA